MHGVSVRVQLPRQYWYRTSWMQQRRQQTRFRLGLVEQLAASKQLRMQTLFFLDELASTGHSTRVGRLRHCSCGSLQRFVVFFSVLFCPVHTRSVPRASAGPAGSVQSAGAPAAASCGDSTPSQRARSTMR